MAVIFVEFWELVPKFQYSASFKLWNTMSNVYVHGIIPIMIYDEVSEAFRQIKSVRTNACIKRYDACFAVGVLSRGHSHAAGGVGWGGTTVAFK